MQRLRTYLFAGGGFLCLVGVLTLAAPGRVQSQNPPPTFNTKVTNTPLPVSGSVNANVSGVVQSVQSGSWMFGIDPAHNVTQDTTVAVKLDTANGDLDNIVTATKQLSFDGNNNLKTVSQGTQDVKIVGGTVTAQTSTASNVASFQKDLDSHEGGGLQFSTPINASCLILESDGPSGVVCNVDCDLGGGRSGSLNIGVHSNETKVIPFPQRVRILSVSGQNLDIFNTHFAFNVIGD